MDKERFVASLLTANQNTMKKFKKFVEIEILTLNYLTFKPFKYGNILTDKQILCIQIQYEFPKFKYENKFQLISRVSKPVGLVGFFRFFFPPNKSINKLNLNCKLWQLPAKHS